MKCSTEPRSHAFPHKRGTPQKTGIIRDESLTTLRIPSTHVLGHPFTHHSRYTKSHSFTRLLSLPQSGLR